MISEEAQSLIYQVAAPVIMSQANFQANFSTPRSINIGISVTSSTEDINSNGRHRITATTASAIIGAQEQQLQHQKHQEAALSKFLLPISQLIQGNIGVFDTNRTSPVWWSEELRSLSPGESPRGIQCLTGLAPMNDFQLQDLPLSEELPSLWPGESPKGIQCLAGLAPMNDFQLKDLSLAEELHSLWPGESPRGMQYLDGLAPMNNFQLQNLPLADFQSIHSLASQQCIASAQELQCSGLPCSVMATGAALSTPNQQQLIQSVNSIQTVHTEAHMFNQELQQYPNYPTKWQVIETATTPDTMNILNKPLEITGCNILDQAIAAISTNPTPKELPLSNSDINGSRKKRKTTCSCPYCIESAGSDIDSNTKQHICHVPDCNKVFLRVSNLRAHLRVHSGEKPFVCSWMLCKKRFTRNDQLKRHQISHTGERRFQCAQCLKRFVYKGSLSNHLKRHFNKENLTAGNLMSEMVNNAMIFLI